MKSINPRLYLILVVMVSVFSIMASGQTAPSKFPDVKIENFGQMADGYYRGAQPKPEDYKSLKELGIKTIIDLRGDPKKYAKSAAESLGMHYINIPMSGYKTPKDSQIEEFLKLVNDPETGAIYVHCKAGVHRTGVMGAAYRFTKYGWDYDKVYLEMKNYEFSAGLFHRAFKSYVKNYAKRIEDKKTKSSTEQSVGQTTH